MSESRRTTRRPRRIAVVGGGPIGIEAAVYGHTLGHDVVVLERDRVGEHVRRWGFVELFSPWSLNVSPLGVRLLAAQGVELPAPDSIPRGIEFVDLYLDPLARCLDDRVREGTEVLGVCRRGLLKTEAPGAAHRSTHPFRLLLRDVESDAESEIDADVVIDAAGVFATPGSLGDGGAPAPGERAARERIDYHLRDILGSDRRTYAGRRTLLVGAGHSATTALRQLTELSRTAPDTHVVWARRDRAEEPADQVADDPLAERDRLCRFANDIAASPPNTCTVIPGVTVARIGSVGNRLQVDLHDAADGRTDSVVVDRILALVGYRPDLSVLRELQVHHCYASEGPMKLAAALLATDGGDCLTRSHAGAETLTHPEPDLFIVGHKSFGRRSDFLLRIGQEQVRDVFRLVEKDDALDLHDESAKALR